MASGESPSPGVFGIAKLKGREDYQQWEFAMTNYFRRQGLLKAVQGTDVDTEQDKGSARRVERALGDICLMVDPQNYQYVEGCTTAQEAWKALNDKFKSKGHWRYVLLIRQLSQARFEDFDGMESYIAHITSIGQELKTMKEEVKDKYLVAMIFQGLPNEYDSIVMTICAGNGEMQLDDVILKLLDDSQRRAVSEQANENVMKRDTERGSAQIRRKKRRRNLSSSQKIRSPDIVDVPVEEEFYDADDHEEDERENDREDENANDNHEEADNNQLRRSTRERHRPQRFDEFELYAANLYNEAVFDDHVEPSTVKEALNSKDKDLWVAAMNEELKSYTDIKVWELVNKPDGKNILKCKWVYKIKRNCNGEVVKFKARLVAVGCAQKYGIDFQDTFAPVVRYSTLRLFFALSVKIGLQIHHVDISTAFLNGDLKEDIYMSQPDGIESIPGKVYKLKKAVYGLKQASKCWYDKVHIVMTEMGFNQSEYEPCVYLWKDGFKLVIVALYVDDFFIFFNDSSQCDKLKSVLSVNFSTKDLGPVSECLSMKVTKSEYSIKLDQRAYCEKLLTKFGMLNSVPAKTPIEYGLKLEKSDKCDKSIPYQEAIGGLLYLSLCTRPDIAYSVNYLSRFCNGYSKEHWKAVQRIFRYLRGTMDYGVKYSESEEDVIGYCDASFGNDCTERKSVSGYAVTLSNGAISWESRKQEVTALSSTEAEYICITHASKECMFLQGFLFELCGRYGSILLYNDNMSALKLSEHPGYHSRTKHIDVRFHYIRELCNDGKLELMHMSTKDMPADVLTKGLNHECHVKCIASLGVS
ncbi:hypothetical protein ONE63_011270 [Megalurothrips usitatus]|uniref:Reverse transcriptase Ty1/copia-type domain-containing protein n=1 Tax=Megalurothrips usitatus TaxID=439358 RepID=A0AAV7X3W1_9NEOP|nr:hypothetical protein ONE63_011270 [Megalurothrips usitatus]